MGLPPFRFREKESGRLDARQQRIDRAAYAGLLARGGAVIANFATVPLVLSALDASGYGIWAAITSILSLLLFLDFGVGNGAMSRITEALAREDQARVADLLRSAYMLLFAISGMIVVVVAVAWWWGLFEAAARHTGSFLQTHTELVVLFVIGYALVVPASFVQRLMYAYQKAGDATQTQFVFSAGYLLLSALGALTKQGLAFFVLGFVGMMVVAYGGATWYFLTRYCPRGFMTGGVDTVMMRSLLADAGLFFLLQVTVSLVYNSDQIILSSVTKPEAVASYATVFKMFSVVTMVNGIILGPLWPAVTDAVARNDQPWIRRAYFKNMRRALMMSVGVALLIFLLAPYLLQIWTGGHVSATSGLLGLMAIWVVCDGYGQCMAMLLNGLRIVRLQLIVAFLLLICGSVLKIYLASSIGLLGPLLGTIIAFTLIVGFGETFYINRIFGRNQ